MNQLVSMLKHKRKVGLHKVVILLCLTGSTSLLSMNVLAVVENQRQTSIAPVAASHSGQDRVIIEPAPLVTPLILELSATQQAKLISEGKLSSTALVSAYLARIDAMDRKGPSVQSISVSYTHLTLPTICSV